MAVLPLTIIIMGVLLISDFLIGSSAFEPFMLGVFMAWFGVGSLAAVAVKDGVVLEEEKEWTTLWKYARCYELPSLMLGVSAYGTYLLLMARESWGTNPGKEIALALVLTIAAGYGMFLAVRRKKC